MKRFLFKCVGVFMCFRAGWVAAAAGWRCSGAALWQRRVLQVLGGQAGRVGSAVHPAAAAGLSEESGAPAWLPRQQVGPWTGEGEPLYNSLRYSSPFHVWLQKESHGQTNSHPSRPNPPAHVPAFLQAPWINRSEHRLQTFSPECRCLCKGNEKIEMQEMQIKLYL